MNKLVRAAVVLIALSVMSISGYKLLEIFSEYRQGENVYIGALDEFVLSESTKAPDKNTDTIDGPNRTMPPRTEDVFKKEVPIEIDFDSLIQKYPDVIGWIYCENTPINYPVVQADDNDHYLYRTYNGQDNKAGSIYADFRNSADFSDLNTLIYGHNMKNDSMFGTLKDYYKQEYYNEHPVIWLLTPEKNYRLDLLAGKIVDVSSDAYTLFEDGDEFSEHVKWLMKRSSFEANVDAESVERIVTLSTCTSAGDDDERYIVACALVEID